jgi:Asp-tRNA(Asn)/Glu-tRNA(Gln) amidotransferase A subunit family amidase
MGFAGMSIPGHPSPDGRPIGVQLVAPFGADAVIIEIARHLEQAMPWQDRWPALATAG